MQRTLPPADTAEKGHSALVPGRVQRRSVSRTMELVGPWRRPTEAEDFDLTKPGKVIPIPEDCGLAAGRHAQPPALAPRETRTPTLP